jgi:ACT domain-containing protein
MWCGMKRTMSKTLDKIYQLVKDKKQIDILTFCDLLNMSPSSYYNYKKFVLHRYPNIIEENQKLVWVESDVS